MLELMDIKFSTENFIKRLDRELTHDYECQEALKFIISDLFLRDIDSPYEDLFFKQLIEEGDVENKLLRSIIRSNSFKEWSQYELAQNIETLLSKFSIEDNKVKIFRAITCSYDWINKAAKADKIKTGEYWSYCYEGAIPYNGCPSEQEYIFFAQISKQSIDWFKTVILNLCPIYGEDEQEVRLFSKKRLSNFSVEKVGDILHYTFSKKVYS